MSAVSNLLHMGVDDVTVEVEAQRVAQSAQWEATFWMRMYPKMTHAWEFGDVATGQGQTETEAIVQAAESWLHRVPATVVPALFGRSLYDDCRTVEPGALDGLPGRRIFSSPLQLRGQVPQPLSDDILWKTVRGTILEHLSPDIVHWVKLFYRANGWQHLSNCFLDNRNWHIGRDALLECEFPQTDELVMLWQFVVIVPQDQPLTFPTTGGEEAFAYHLAPKGPSPELTTTRDRVLLTLQLIRETRDANGNAIRDVLIRRGLDEREAPLLVALVEIAYGRAVFEFPAPLPDRYWLVESGQKTEKRLSAEPVFKIALLIANEEIASGVDRDSLLAVAGRSGEGRALIHTLQNDSDANELSIENVIVLS